MLRLETDKGNTYDGCVVSKGYDGTVSIMLPDDRLISIIAPEFEGINYMKYIVTESETPYEKEYIGYSVLSSIIRLDISGQVQISVKKPGGD